MDRYYADMARDADPPAADGSFTSADDALDHAIDQARAEGTAVYVVAEYDPAACRYRYRCYSEFGAGDHEAVAYPDGSYDDEPFRYL